MADTVLTVDQIIADFGDYYLDNGQNLQNLHTLPFESFESKDTFTAWPTNETIVRESNVEFQSVLQQYQDTFTPMGGVEFKPVTIPLFQIKIDQMYNPTKLQRTWLAFLASNNTDRMSWPFIAWFIQIYLMKKAMMDLEMKAIYGGVYQAPEEGVPGLPENTLNGVEYQLNQFQTAGTLTPITMGTVPTDEVLFVNYVEAFVQSIPELYRYIPMDLNMNRTLRDRFKRGMRKKYNTYYDQTQSSVNVVDLENITVEGLPSMQGKNRIWCTPNVNALMPIKGFSNAQAFEIEKVDRKVKIYTDWWMGVGFINPKLIFTSDQS